jgi:hypothetical protein
VDVGPSKMVCQENAHEEAKRTEVHNLLYVQLTASYRKLLSLSCLLRTRAVSTGVKSPKQGTYHSSPSYKICIYDFSSLNSIYVSFFLIAILADLPNDMSQCIRIMKLFMQFSAVSC